MCGCNAPRDVRPESSGPHFIRGDTGFISHVAQAHDITRTTKNNLEELCDREEVDYEDAISMSKGEVPKKPVMLINSLRNIPYEDFKSSSIYRRIAYELRHLEGIGERTLPSAASLDTYQTNHISAVAIPPPTNSFTTSEDHTQSSEKISLKRNVQSRAATSDIEDTIAVGSHRPTSRDNPIVLDTTESEESEDAVPLRKRVRKRKSDRSKPL